MSEKWIGGLFGEAHTKFRPKGTTNDPFRLATYKRNYAVIPIVLLCIADMAWVTYCSIQGFIKTNVILTRWDRTQGEMTDLLIHPINRKFWTWKQTFPIQQELYDTYEDMKCETEYREEDCKKNKPTDECTNDHDQ